MHMLGYIREPFTLNSFEIAAILPYIERRGSIRLGFIELMFRQKLFPSRHIERNNYFVNIQNNHELVLIHVAVEAVIVWNDF